MNHILYATDKNYCEVCAVSLYSLLKNFSGKALIHIIESNLEDKKEDLISVAKMFNQEIDFISIDEISKRLIDNNIPPYRGGYSPYARFFISDYVNEGKILYLDCDILITSDIASLFEFDLKGNPMGAVIDQCSSYANYLIGNNRKDIYYNSGVLLLDSAKCREVSFPQKFLDTVKTIDLSNTFLGADQDIMNVAFYNQISTLPVTYNMMYTTRTFSGKNCYRLASKNPATYYPEEEFDEARKNPVVIHFAGGGKYQPWREEGVSFSKKEASMWASTYEELYPNGKYSSILSKKEGSKPPKFPTLHSLVKGFLRNVRLIPKLIKAKI
ncbi:MAG: glycosyltransferase family 8 protein [Saccharofermentans sp.]|nr:glycosyltransferase family 8 protein [Saccharofermentans sp.]